MELKPIKGNPGTYYLEKLTPLEQGTIEAAFTEDVCLRADELTTEGTEDKELDEIPQWDIECALLDEDASFKISQEEIEHLRAVLILFGTRTRKAARGKLDAVESFDYDINSNVPHRLLQQEIAKRLAHDLAFKNKFAGVIEAVDPDSPKTDDEMVDMALINMFKPKSKPRDKSRTTSRSKTIPQNPKED